LRVYIQGWQVGDKESSWKLMILCNRDEFITSSGFAAIFAYVCIERETVNTARHLAGRGR